MNVDPAITGWYFVGVDLGQSRDFTALTGKFDAAMCAWRKKVARLPRRRDEWSECWGDSGRWPPGARSRTGGPIAGLHPIGPQDLDGDLVRQPVVSGAVHLSHASCSEQREDFIRSETSVRRQGHSLLFPPVVPRDHPVETQAR